MALPDGPLGRLPLGLGEGGPGEALAVRGADPGPVDHDVQPGQRAAEGGGPRPLRQLPAPGHEPPERLVLAPGVLAPLDEQCGGLRVGVGVAPGQLGGQVRPGPAATVRVVLDRVLPDALREAVGQLVHQGEGAVGEAPDARADQARAELDLLHRRDFPVGDHRVRPHRGGQVLPHHEPDLAHPAAQPGEALLEGGVVGGGSRAVQHRGRGQLRHGAEGDDRVDPGGDRGQHLLLGRGQVSGQGGFLRGSVRQPAFLAGRFTRRRADGMMTDGNGQRINTGRPVFLRTPTNRGPAGTGPRLRFRGNKLSIV